MHHGMAIQYSNKYTSKKLFNTKNMNQKSKFSSTFVPIETI